MIARRHRTTHAAAALLCGLLALPGAALADSSGGTGLGGTATKPLGNPLAPSPTTRSGSIPVSATGSGITLRTTASAMLRRGLTFSGTASAAAGKTIEIERSGRETGWQWSPTASATVASNGTFRATWNTNHIGRFAIRAVVVASQVSAALADAQPSGSTSSLTVTVYRPSKATLYGPGFYGRKTACGVRLTKTTIGVANRTLRCGESVALLYDGRTLVVPVIDRGPYANGADWDLTTATGRALGMTGTEQIGAVSLPTAPAAASAARR